MNLDHFHLLESNTNVEKVKARAITNIFWEIYPEHLGPHLNIWAWASRNVKLTETKMQMNNGKDIKVLDGKTMLIFNFCKGIHM